MNCLILFLALKYLLCVSATNTSGKKEVIELISAEDEISVSTGNVLTPNLRSPGDALYFPTDIVFEPSTNSTSRKRSRISESELINFDDDESTYAVQAKEESKEEEEYLDTRVKRSCVSVVEKMDAKMLASMLPLLNSNTIREHLIALGEDVKAPIKENCGWNLLHEAVYTDNYEVAQILLTEFGFDPNAFDPYFGSVVYLVQSTRIVELLKSSGAILYDQRPCHLHDSALESARTRSKLALIAMVLSFESRLDRLYDDLIANQSTSAATN